MRLEAWFVPAAGTAGSMRMRLVNTGPDAIVDFELTFTTVVQLDPDPPARLVARRSGCHVVAPPTGFVLGPGAVWELNATCGHRPGHANDGPASAFVTVGERVLTVSTGGTGRVVIGDHAPVTYRPDGEVAAAALAAVAARDERLHPYRPAVLSPGGQHAVSASLAPALPADAFRLAPVHAGWSVEAGSAGAVERALTVLVRPPVPVSR